jgi:hypothetical protein
MRIIDEKGRIFGKLNVIDFVVIILVIAVLAVLGMKLVSRGALGVTETTKLTYTVKVAAVEPEVYEAVLENIPGQLMASGEMLNANVVAVEASPAVNGASLNTEGGALDVTLRNDLLDLVFTIEANVTNTVTNEIGTQEIRIGKSHIVKTAKFEMPSGVILSCEWGE